MTYETPELLRVGAAQETILGGIPGDDGPDSPAPPVSNLAELW